MKNNKSSKKVDEILKRLEEQYPAADCELVYRTPFQLLVATVLSAQSTDKTVNKVTKTLFERYPTVEDFLQLDENQLQNEIKEIGLYRNKSKNILALCKGLVLRFKGEVPSDMESLVSLPGVGRKTANVVMSNAFGIPAIAVDTHVFRVSNRIGLAAANNVEDTEQQLMKNIQKDKWSKAHHLLIWHGRRICHARNPKCGECPINEQCDYASRINDINRTE